MKVIIVTSTYRARFGFSFSPSHPLFLEEGALFLSIISQAEFGTFSNSGWQVGGKKWGETKFNKPFAEIHTGGLL